MTATPELDRAIAAAGEFAAALSELKGRIQTLSKGLETPFEGDAIARHRAEHKAGSVNKIEADPELRAFVMARISTHTFEAIVAAAAEAFPPARRPSRAGLHRWWHRYGKPASPTTSHQQLPAITSCPPP